MFNDKILKVINNYLRYNHTKLAIGIVYKNKTYMVSYSFKKEDAAINDDLYDIGSISKVFTSLLVLKEIENGKISLEDNISQYLPLKKGHYWSIGDLLKHRCDFHHVTPYQIVVKSLLRSGYQRRNLYESINNERVIKEINKRRKHHNIRHYGYSDFATAMLVMALEEINKGPFVEQMNDFIKNDFNLSKTTCINERTVRVDSYIKNHKVSPWKWEDNNPYIGGGGIASSISDMTFFIKQLIERKEDGFIKKSFSSDIDDTEHNLTYFLSKRKTSFWHVGGAGTFRSSLIINPKREIGVIVLGNQVGYKEGNAHYLSKMIYTNLRRNKRDILPPLKEVGASC